MNDERELYWYDDATYDIGFYNYYQRTVDPSPWAFLVCSFYCAALALLLPRQLEYYRSQQLYAKKETEAESFNNYAVDESIVLGSQEFIASDLDETPNEKSFAQHQEDSQNAAQDATSLPENANKLVTLSPGKRRRTGLSLGRFFPKIRTSSMKSSRKEETNHSIDYATMEDTDNEIVQVTVHNEEGKVASNDGIPSGEFSRVSKQEPPVSSESGTTNPLQTTKMNLRNFLPLDFKISTQSPALSESGTKINLDTANPSGDIPRTPKQYPTVSETGLSPIEAIKRNLEIFPNLLSESMSWEEEFDSSAQSTLYYHRKTGKRTTDEPVDRIPEHIQDAWYFYYCSPAFRRKINKGRKWDKEMEKLVGLVLPYTAHTIVVNLCGLFEVGIIGRTLGTSDLSAYFATEFAISFATMFFHGILASLKVLVSQAHGAKNIKLAGMYVQIGIWTHHLFSLPLILYGWNNFDEIVLRLGLDEDTAESAEQYARFVFIYEAVGIYDGALHCVMDVTGHEKYSAISNSVRAFVSFLAVLIVSKVNRRAELWMIGAIHLIAKGIFIIFNIGVILHRRWLDDYWNEWERNPFKHWRHIKSMWKASLRLSSGRVIENCEWNILFVFSAIQGPAEVAIWGLVGELWDFTDDIVIAISDASKVRCAHLLGSGLPEQARYTSEKSLFIGVAASIIISILLGFLQSTIPRWLTNDFTLQRLLGDMIPLLGLAVATLSFGSVCWSILCAQGRSHLATAVTGFGSLAIALPLACISNFWWNLNLQGLIASLIIGYASSSFAHAILMLTSDWPAISEKVRKRTARIEEQLDMSNAFRLHRTDSKSTGITSVEI